MPTTPSFALTWDANGERLYETGVDRGVLYTPSTSGNTTDPYGTATVWNGLTAFNESPDGGEPNAIWADNIKYLNLISSEDFGFTIEAYTYPDEFAECDGSAAVATGVYIGQQTRKPFGFSCRTLLGNDEASNDYGYKLHLCYGCLASPSEKSYSTVNDSPEAISFSWDVSTTPVAVEGYRPTAHIVIDSTKADATKLAALEALLYGTTGSTPTTGHLPDPATVISTLS